MTREKERTNVREKAKKPPMYEVILFNDDFTPAEFVVEVLNRVFKIPQQQSFQIMATAHQSGEALVGRYQKDIAISKAKKAESIAEEAGYPLGIEAVEEGD